MNVAESSSKMSAPSLRRELFLALTAKFLLLWGLWFFFFRAEPPPTDRSDFDSRLFGGDAASISTTIDPPVSDVRR